MPKDTKWGAPTVVAQGDANKVGGNGTKTATVLFEIPAPHKPKQVKGTSISNVDGDTTKVRTTDGEIINCRVGIIDAPEIGKTVDGKKKEGQPYGEESKNWLGQQMLNKELTITVIEAPSEKNFGRSLCEIQVEGKDISLESVKAGASHLFSQHAPPAFKQAYAEAKLKGIGLHADPNAVHPRKFKHPK